MDKTCVRMNNYYWREKHKIRQHISFCLWCRIDVLLEFNQLPRHRTYDKTFNENINCLDSRIKREMLIGFNVIPEM